MMNKGKSFIAHHGLFTTILLFSLGWRLIVYQPHLPLWDGAVYILMGKYLFSGGQVGLMEPFRAVAWPGFLGSLWFLGGDPIAWGRVFEVAFSLGIIILVYLIGTEVYGKKQGILAALFLTLSPTYMFWGNCLYPDIPSTFLGLLMLFLFFKEKFFLSGMAAALAFFTKYTQALPIVIFACLFSWDKRPLRISKDFLKFFIGLSLISFVFLEIHQRQYHHMLYPFLEAEKIYTQLHFSWHKQIAYALRRLWGVESFIFIFAVWNLFLFKNTLRDKRKIALTLIGWLSFFSVLKLPTDLPRFFIPALPYLYILSADGIFDILQGIRTKPFLKILLILLILFSTGIQFDRARHIRYPKDERNIVHDYINKNIQDIEKATLWTSNPTFLSPFNLKTNEVMYYPIFNKKKIDLLRRQLTQADYIFWDSRTLLCRPTGDAACEKAKNDLFQDIRKEFRIVATQSDLSEKKKVIIFKRSEYFLKSRH